MIFYVFVNKIHTNIDHIIMINTINVKNMHPHRDSSPGLWNTVKMHAKEWNGLTLVIMKIGIIKQLLTYCWVT